MKWKSKNKFVIARSSAEVEFRFMAHGVCEIMRVVFFFRRFAFPLLDH